MTLCTHTAFTTTSKIAVVFVATSFTGQEMRVEKYSPETSCTRASTVINSMGMHTTVLSQNPSPRYIRHKGQFKLSECEREVEEEIEKGRGERETMYIDITVL